MTCTDCFLYAGGGFGFEFETSWVSLVYMRIWLEAEFSMSINIDIQANGKANSTEAGNFSAYGEVPSINYWTQERERNVDITEISPAKFSKTKKVLKKDLIFKVSCPDTRYSRMQITNVQHDCDSVADLSPVALPTPDPTAQARSGRESSGGVRRYQVFYVICILLWTYNECLSIPPGTETLPKRPSPFAKTPFAKNQPALPLLSSNPRLTRTPAPRRSRGSMCT